MALTLLKAKVKPQGRWPRGFRICKYDTCIKPRRCTLWTVELTCSLCHKSLNAMIMHADKSLGHPRIAHQLNVITTIVLCWAASGVLSCSGETFPSTPQHNYTQQVDDQLLERTMSGQYYRDDPVKQRNCSMPRDVRFLTRKITSANRYLPAVQSTFI